MKKKLLFGSILLAIALSGCTQKNSDDFIVNTSQDVELLYNEEVTSGAIKIDTSGKGDNEALASISVAADPKNNASILKFSDDLTPGSFDISDYKLTVNGVSVGLGQDFTADSEKVGSPRIEKSKACLESGYDTDYYYDDDKFVVYTLVNDSKQIVFDIEIRDGKYTTLKGAKVGESTKDDLYEMYGMPSDYSGVMFRYFLEDEEYSLEFTFDDNGVVEAIDYIDNSVM